jgi:hypothetical protein
MSTDTRRRPLRLPESFTTLLIGAGLIAAAYLHHRRNDPPPPWAILAFILMAIAGFIFATVAYLQAGGERAERAIRSGARNSVRDNMRDSVRDSSRDSVDDVAPSTEHQGSGDAIEASLKDTRGRFLTEMAALGRRANINLGVGGGIALFGLSFLAYVVLQTPRDGGGAAAIAQSYLPKLSLVFAIELLAFFFLSLYRSNLAEIKYFQNETTNIESRLLALRVALSVKSDELTKDVVAQLARTERNFVIDKGHTTIDLERARLENEAAASLGKLVDAVGSLKKS